MAVHLIDVLVADDGSILDPGSTTARPGDYLVFIVKNDDSARHTVCVPPSEFHRKKAGDPSEPIDPYAISCAEIDPGERGAIVLRVKGKGHFPPKKPGGRLRKGGVLKKAAVASYIYKYTIKASGLPDLDPNIEINI